MAWSGAQAATFYVRADGGDASQCTGRSDAAYPGSGSARDCAWKNPNIALPNSGTRRIAGGDTLMIGAGTYQIGSSGYMQPVPSGPSTSSRTRILGKAGTKLVGVGGTHRVLNLDGSSNVEIGNLEITDGSDCVYNHSSAAAKCTSSMDWARVGVYANNSHDVWLHNLNVHGMGARGFQAGGIRNWTLEHVKINRNGSAGWDGNVDGAPPDSGNITLRDIEIAWNGCGERVATGAAWACWAQQAGGYGDGFGTTTTGGNWLVEDAFIHHNTSDGLDLRYMDGGDDTHVTLRRIYSVANAGNQVKIRGNSLIENSVLVGDCTFFRGRDYMTTGDLCRAYGSTLLLILTGNDTATVRQNTIAGEGDAQIAYGEGSSSDRIYIQNNVVVGFPYYASTGNNTSFSAGGAPGSKSFSGNLGWNVRNCPGGGTCNQDPKLTNMTLAGFDAQPLAGSPVIDKAPMISGVNTDFLLQPRPSGAANDIGAYEMQAGGTPPPPPPPPVSGDAKYDFDGDGRSDVLWRNDRTGVNAIWKSARSSTQQSIARVTDTAWKIVGADDFDGDGKADVLWRNSSTGADTIWKSGNARTPQAIRDISDLTWQVVGTGDFNGDGKADVLWRNSRTGANTIWKSGDGSTPQAMRGVTNLDWKVAGTGDFDGDGKADVLWRNGRSGANTIWKSASTAQSMRGVGDLAWHVAGTGDFNGDGKFDVLWHNTRTGANTIWKSGNAATPQSVIGVASLAWDIVATGDFDGDGKADALWRNKSTGAGVIWKSANGTTAQTIGRVADSAWNVEP